MRGLALCALVCAFSGCSLISRQPPKTEFDFGPVSEQLRGASAAAPIDLVVHDITAPAWLDGSAMYYRLVYKNATVPVPYAGSEWVTSPAALLTQRLRTAVAGAAGAKGRSPAPAAAPAYVLRAELLQFEQIFDEPHKSRGVLLLHATLERNGRTERRTFEIEKSAPTPDAAGGARALSLCSDELVALISQWVVQQQGPDVS